MADTNITPPQGALTATGAVMRVITIGLVLMGSTPVVSLGIVPPAGHLTLGVTVPNTTIEVPTGSAVFFGSAPTVSELALETRLRFTGYAPSIGGQNTTLTPDKASLVLGITLGSSVSIHGTSGSLILQGSVPTVINPQAVIPPTGSLVLTGHGPVVSQEPKPTAGTLTTAGYAPLMNLGIAPGEGLLRCTPSATVEWLANTDSDLASYKVYRGTTSGVYTTSVNVGLATFYVWDNLPDGRNYFAVTALDTSGNESGYSSEVSLVVSGRTYAPTVTIGTGTGTQIDTGLGSLSLTGQVPVVGLGVVPTTASLTMTGYTVSPVPGQGTLTVTGFTPGVTHGGPINFTVVPDPATLTLVGYAKLQYAEPAWDVLTLQSYAGSVSVQVLGSASITPDSGSLIFFSPTPFNPNLAQHANSIIAPGGTPDHA